MNKTLCINTGTALLLNEGSDAFSGYSSVSINTGNAIVSRKMYDKLIQLNVSLNCGNMSIIDICGNVVELASGTTITESMSYCGCYLLCDGKLVIESAKGIADVTGLYANTIFNPESVDLNTVKGITSIRRVHYPDGAKLLLKSITLDEETVFTMDKPAYFVDGTITALDSNSLGILSQKEVSFICNKLIIHTSHYEKYRGMFKAGKIVLVPDDHTFVEDIKLDAATSAIYGDKLFVFGDLKIMHDQAKHLQGFASLIVKGTATMPVSAAKDFKKIGKADDYDFYEGVLVNVNGRETYDHAQLQEAQRLGISYTIKVNGEVAFLEDVTAEDIEAISAVYCNGVIYASGNARSALDSKIRAMNGEILDIEMYGKEYESEQNNNENMINVGTYKQI